jgi:hypothetical protein
MSYLTRFVTSRSTRARRADARVDERTLLNYPEFDGGAHVRAFVEDTSAKKVRRGRLPEPRLKLRITDCCNEINLEFSVESAAYRANSLHKIETLIAALERFRAGLEAEAELRELRESGSRPASCGPEWPGYPDLRAAAAGDPGLRLHDRSSPQNTKGGATCRT